MGDLSKNFSTWEFECPCCKQVKTDEKLINVLQKLRDIVGRPIIITSGYRCEKRQKEVNSQVAFSYHVYGAAADITIKDYSVLQMYILADECLRGETMSDNGGIGVYPQENFIHIDVRNYHARWGRVNGVYVSLTDTINLMIGFKYA